MQASSLLLLGLALCSCFFSSQGLGPCSFPDLLIPSVLRCRLHLWVTMELSRNNILCSSNYAISWCHDCI